MRMCCLLSKLDSETSFSEEENSEYSSLRFVEDTSNNERNSEVYDSCSVSAEKFLEIIPINVEKLTIDNIEEKFTLLNTRNPNDTSIITFLRDEEKKRFEIPSLILPIMDTVPNESNTTQIKENNIELSNIELRRTLVKKLLNVKKESKNNALVINKVENKKINENNIYYHRNKLKEESTKA